MSGLSDNDDARPGLLYALSETGSFEMDHSTVSRISSRQSKVSGSEPRAVIAGVARHTLGLCLLLLVVFLWTLSSFLGSSIFADNTYAKPFFLTYFNTSTFILVMVPHLIRSCYRKYREGNLSTLLQRLRPRSHFKPYPSDDANESEAFLKPDDYDHSLRASNTRPRTHLGLRSTSRLALTFCILWFGANYFAMACLQYTTVASTTILTSTSSIWTLLIGTLTHTEKFSWRKLCGVLGSLIGVVIISRVDLTNSPPTNHDRNTLLPRTIKKFPDKSPTELAFGDAFALLSAIIYGCYTIALKRASLTAAPLQLDMPLFFGLVGLFNVVFLWPLLPILSATGLEKFQLPPTRRIWTILLVNSTCSLFSDICWAYAMVLTSPLVVTVGLSLTIPLSLVGEMVIQGRTEGWVYWIGATTVVLSFVFVDREVKDEVDDPLLITKPIVDSPIQGEETAAVSGELLR